MPSPLLETPRACVKLAGLVALLAAASVAGVVLSTARFEGELTEHTLRTVGEYSARDLSTAIYDGGRLRLRASAESVRFVQPRAFGPFRIGFLQVLEASGVSFETFATAGVDSTDADVANAISSLVRDPRVLGRLPHDTVGVDLHRVRIVQRSEEKAHAALEAQRCHSRFRARRIVCENGTLASARGRTYFKKAEYDGHSWRVTAAKLEG